MKTKPIIIVSSGLLLVGLAAWFVRSRIQIVDPTPAISFTDNYYAELKGGGAARVLGMYEPSIPTGDTDALPRLLLSMQSGHGNVVSAELQSGIIAPKGDVPCYWLSYNVARVSAKTVENLLVCPQSAQRLFNITGHEFLNLATGQRLSFGTTVQTKTISISNAP